MGNDRHADLSLSGTAGRDQHTLTPPAGKCSVHGLLLVAPQRKARSIKIDWFAFESLDLCSGACGPRPPDLFRHAARQGEGVALDLVQHHCLRDVVGGPAQPQGVLKLGIRHGQLMDELVQQRRRHILQVEFSIQRIDHGCTTSSTLRISVGRPSSFTLPRSPLSMRSRM